jgi:hypothetical protein
VKNDCDESIEVFWSDGNGRLLSMATVAPAKQKSILTYDTHKFIIKSMVDKSSPEVAFVKGPYDEILTVSYGAESGFIVDVSHPFTLMEILLDNALAVCPDQTHFDHTDCLTKQTYPAMDQIIKHQQNVKMYRDKISDKLRNYTCADDSLPTSTPKSSVVEFVYDKEYTVDTYLQLEHAKIWAVRDFITDDECEVLMDYGRPRLERAAVVGEGE